MWSAVDNKKLRDSDSEVTNWYYYFKYFQLLFDVLCPWGFHWLHKSTTHNAQMTCVGLKSIKYGERRCNLIKMNRKGINLKFNVYIS